jgi:3-isopropylmalate dehydrogenase
MFELRSALGVYANLRPTRKPDERGNVDLIVVRELLGGLYYGARGIREEDGKTFDTCEYSEDEIRRVVRKAFELAQTRRKSVASVDKANVLATSRLWRRVAGEVQRDFADVTLSHLYVDAAAMSLVMEPWRFDVIVTDNLFGDILSEVAAGVAGGIGLAASASLGDQGPNLYEPIHGSAPDIAGQGVANPAALLRSVTLMLRLSFGDEERASRLERAIDEALRLSPTRDLGGHASTSEFGSAVLRCLNGDGDDMAQPTGSAAQVNLSP